MKNYLTIHPWKIVERGFYPEFNRITESLCSIGNGKMGMRANFEETYSGDSLQGNYIAGIYYPDKTKVGWWKNGYPEYFAKVLNAVNWIGLVVKIDQEIVDLATVEILDFYRELNMKKGFLKREFRAKLPSGKIVRIISKRFYHMDLDEVGALSYAVLAENFCGIVEIDSFLDFNVHNDDANYNEQFWRGISRNIDTSFGYVKAATKKTGFQVVAGMSHELYLNNEKLGVLPKTGKAKQKVFHSFQMKVEKGEELQLLKYCSIVSSFYHPPAGLLKKSKDNITTAMEIGFPALMKMQSEAWDKKWATNDIEIKGDMRAQQAIRFNIFQLNQTYTGKDPRLNIGPKGFTGEKYGGSTYWDTEAYCLPFYLSTAEQHVAKNLLIYRYKHLEKAIENAEKLGFKDGAALYPMVTMNGEECHNEWEITFEEIHRNGAIAYAIFDYIRYTGDKDYLIEYGLEVLIGIARFWAQRMTFSADKQQYVMLGVTGPNEYENNVNNNWYTGYIARWCLTYAKESLQYVQNKSPHTLSKLLRKIRFKEKELQSWQSIIENTYLPEDKKRGIFLQQDGFLDKELIPVAKLPKEDLPLNQNWSWDRILRSCYIKQADVLQGIYFFEEEFDNETIARNFDFYEPLTVHESSLSPCVHSILAAKIGREEKAYEMFLRTSRLDLDDVNNDTEDGCHITSMAGTWMAFVKGFGGLRVSNDTPVLHPILPEQWKGYTFIIGFRGITLKISVQKEIVDIISSAKKELNILLYGKKVTVKPGKNSYKKSVFV